MRDQAIDRMSREVEEVARLGYALFRDPQGPLALYPHSGPTLHTRISWSREPEPGLDPAAIVARLEATASGCRWLLQRWAELRAILEAGRKWQGPDRFRAARLLGRQPLDALDDERVMAIHLACRAMDPSGPVSFADVANEMSEQDFRAFERRAEGRGAKARTPADPAAGKAALLAMIDGAVRRLEARLAIHRDRESAELAAMPALAFDDSPDAELLRRYQLSSSRMFLGTINTFFKVRKEMARDLDDAETDPGTLEASVAVAPPDDLHDETKPILGGEAMTTLLLEGDVVSVDETKPIPEEGPPVGGASENRRQESPEEARRERLAAGHAEPGDAAPDALADGEEVGRPCGDRAESADRAGRRGGAVPPVDGADAPATDTGGVLDPGPEGAGGGAAVDWEAEKEQTIEGLVEAMTARWKLPPLLGDIMGRGPELGAVPGEIRSKPRNPKRRPR